MFECSPSASKLVYVLREQCEDWRGYGVSCKMGEEEKKGAAGDGAKH